MSEATHPTYGQRLRALRRHRSLNQRELQERSGVDQTLISRYELDKALPPQATADALDKALGQPAASFEPSALDHVLPGRGCALTRTVAEIVRRYQLMRRVEVGRPGPGDDKVARRYFVIWRESLWLANALEAGILPPGPELGGEFGDLGEAQQPAPA